MLRLKVLNPTNCARLELAARRAVMIERAVKVNPKVPSFEGLHKMIEHAQDEAGGVATRRLTAHMAQQAGTEARVLKRSRVPREELEAKGKERRNNTDERGKDAENA